MSATDQADVRDTRTRILDTAARLVASGGVAALTTRAVAAAAGVQAPVLYRLFGDKRGLLDAVAEHWLGAFTAGKIASEPHPDPVQDLRDAWDAYVAFGLGNPAVFAIINEVGRSGPPSPAARAGIAVLEQRVRRIARTGRLRVPEDRAVALIHAAGTGVVAILLAVDAGSRDPALPSFAREAVLSAVTYVTETAADAEAPRLAVALKAHLDEADRLTPGERLLLHELLTRIADPA